MSYGLIVAIIVLICIICGLLFAASSQHMSEEQNPYPDYYEDK